MIAGRLHWKPRGVRLSGKNNLAAFDFPEARLLLTEAGTKRRASLHLLQGEAALRAQDPAAWRSSRRRSMRFEPLCGSEITRSSGP